MKTIIAGGRDFTDYARLAAILDRHTEITEVVCGMALSWKWKHDPQIGGVDRIGYRWAKNKRIPIMPFEANWKGHGATAGYIRNQAMALYAEQLIAFWDGQSKGTANMIGTMQRLGKPFTVYRTDRPIILPSRLE